VARAEVGYQGEDDPGESQGGDDEEDEDVFRGELVGADVLVDEPGEHADYWDGDEEFEDAPGEEEEAGEGHCGWLVGVVSTGGSGERLRWVRWCCKTVVVGGGFKRTSKCLCGEAVQQSGLMRRDAGEVMVMR